MLIGSIPAKFNIPFANAAGAGFVRPIPEASQISITAGAASLTDGFPPVCFLPIGAGGVPPFGQDVNGILNQISLWNQWQQAGAPVPYDSAFQGSIGGYPNGALVPSATSPGLYWYSTVDSNTSNPDTGGANWIPVPLVGGTFTTGAWAWRPTEETLTGWVKANGTTIGNAGSGAAQLAAASAAALYAWLWTNFSNTQCPVSTGRGPSAASDFAALKTITLLDMRGLGPMGMDTMGGAPTTFLAGVPATSGSGTQSGSVLGQNLHALITAELAAHAHTVNDTGHAHGISDPTHFHNLNNANLVYRFIGGGPNLDGPGANNYTTSTISVIPSVTGVVVNSNTTGITLQNTGSGTAHNTVQRSMTGTHYLKL